MRITLTDAGKRYNRDWIFRHLSYEFRPGLSYAITGPNGSGKSTLLQLIAGSIMPSEGEITYQGSEPVEMSEQNSKPIAPQEIYTHISISAPYLEIVEEMTLSEFLRFHSLFKPFLPSLSQEEIASLVGLEHGSEKQIRFYSSGMKQRVKLAQAFFSNTSILLLDEPCTNLDQEGIDAYRKLVSEYCRNRLVIVSSNDSQEYAFCTQRLSLSQYK
jgi:ABC-type multidrug transport system ATPase subunit